MELRRKPIVLAAQRSGAPRSAQKEPLTVAVYRGEDICSNTTYERRVDAECAFAEAVVRAERSVSKAGEPCRIELKLGHVLLDIARVAAPQRQ